MTVDFLALTTFCDFFPGKESQTPPLPQQNAIWVEFLGQFYMRRVRLTRGIPVISLEISREIQWGREKYGERNLGTLGGKYTSTLMYGVSISK
jgi:hypothetical protein